MYQTNHRPVPHNLSFLAKSSDNCRKLGPIALALFVLTFFTESALGQVLINPHPIVGYQFSSKDILNFDVVNTTKTAVMVQYTASLTDARGQMVVQYRSGKHVLPSGSANYNPTTFKIAATNYLNKTIAQIERTSKFIPSGDYTYCINITCLDREQVCQSVFKSETNYQACGDAHAEPATPLLLSMPEDEETLEQKRPNFSWIPPMPIGSNPEIRYTFSLTKMREKQTAEDAIRRNRPLYKQEGINGVSLMFPNQLEDLEESAKYAWQVSAHIGEQHIATSDVWEFEIEKPQIVKVSFVVKKQIGLEEYQHPINEPFRLIFSERYSNPEDTDWKIRIRKNESSSWETLDYLKLENHSKGKQQIVLRPEELILVEENNSYVIEVTNFKQEKYFVRIHFLPETNKNK